MNGNEDQGHIILTLKRPNKDCPTNNIVLDTHNTYDTDLLLSAVFLFEQARKQIGTKPDDDFVLTDILVDLLYAFVGQPMPSKPKEETKCQKR